MEIAYIIHYNLAGTGYFVCKYRVTHHAKFVYLTDLDLPRLDFSSQDEMETVSKYLQHEMNYLCFPSIAKIPNCCMCFFKHEYKAVNTNFTK